MRCLTTLALALLLSSAPAADDPLSPDLMRHTRSVCDTYGVDMSLALAVMRVESGFDPDAVNYDGTCIGLMQIHTGNARWILRDADADIYTPEGSITAGVYILAQGLERYGDVEMALVCYNQGEYSAKKLFAQGVASTSYSKKVIKEIESYASYRDTLPRLTKPYNARKEACLVA